MSEIVCTYCGLTFSTSSRDQAFYSRMEVPPPTHCPRCRLQRKLAHHNQINLFKRPCTKSGKLVISHYPAELTIPVYDQTIWWSDAFDATEYGRPYDFGRSFFDQVQELSAVVPRPALMTDYLNDENCPYTNYSGRNKNCYMIFDSDESWDCYYGYTINNCRSTFESFRVKNLELCYEAIDCKDCYNSSFISNSEGCWDSAFLESCYGCKHSLFCCNLKQKEYHLFNQAVSKERYHEVLSSLGSYERLSELRDEFSHFVSTFPRRAMRGFHNENVTGDYLVHCKNAEQCYDCLDLWDGKYCYQGFMSLKNCMDCEECGEGELLYECSQLGYNAYAVRFSHECLNQLTKLTYCAACFNGCSDLFGCIGLRHKKYCILNRQYSKVEYEELVPRIVAHMKSLGEWGEFFPMQHSLFPYNVSMAQEQFPLTKEEVLRAGLQWKDEEVKGHQVSRVTLPDSVQDTHTDVCTHLLACNECNRNYKIIPQELDFHKRVNLAFSRSCFVCRHTKRRGKRNPRELFERRCEECGKAISTTWSPARPEVVFCEECFADALN